MIGPSSSVSVDPAWQEALAHGLNSDGHNAGSAIAARVRAADCPAAIVSRPPPPDPWPAQHPIDAGVNSDASLYFAAPGSSAIAPRV
jgi:hypothetical protein